MSKKIAHAEHKAVLSVILVQGQLRACFPAHPLLHPQTPPGRVHQGSRSAQTPAAPLLVQKCCLHAFG